MGVADQHFLLDGRSSRCCDPACREVGGYELGVALVAPVVDSGAERKTVFLLATLTKKQCVDQSPPVVSSRKEGALSPFPLADVLLGIVRLCFTSLIVCISVFDYFCLGLL